MNHDHSLIAQLDVITVWLLSIGALVFKNVLLEVPFIRGLASDIKDALTIICLVVTIGYTVHKWITINKHNKNQDDD